MQGSSKQPLMSDLCIVLLGKTGSGKSASGNTIIGERKFVEDFSPASVTRICRSEQTEVDGQTITVIDTVGLPDTLKTITDVQTKIEQIFDYAHDGVDVFLLVIKLGLKFTEESENVVKWIQENFGEKFTNHTIVLFTHGDQLSEPIENYLKKSQTLKSVINTYSKHYIVFNNKHNDHHQVSELLKKINKLRKNNQYMRYTENEYKETQDKILQRKYLTGAAVGGGVGGLGGAASVAVAAKAGSVALTVGKAALIGATGGAALGAAVVCAGVYFFARRYICNSGTGESKNKKQN